MNNYFVYIYLDPTKSGDYIYNEYKFDYEPIYVGCSNYERIYKHLYDVRCNRKLTKYTNACFYQKIKEILDKNKEPIIIKIIDFLSKKEAFLLERKIIGLIGRKSEGTGILTNIAEGGMGYITYGNKNPLFGTKWKEERKVIHGNKVRVWQIENGVVASKEWICIGPDGVEHKITNLRNFCRKNTLGYDSALKYGSTKGWKITRV